MASANKLIANEYNSDGDLIGENHVYRVEAGEFADQWIEVLNNTPVPDGQENQRKILVRLVGVVEDGERPAPIYLLPRLIEDPKTTAKVAAAAGAKVSAAAGTKAVKRTATPAAVRSPLSIAEFGEITDPMDPRLDPYRPDPSIVKEYQNRVLEGGIKDTDKLLDYWRKRTPLLLVGETQAGKTMVVQVIACLAAKEAGFDKPFPIFTLSGSAGVTDFDLFGQPTAYTDPETGEERIVFLNGLVDMAMRFGGFLYLDELNLMHERVTSSLHPITDDRRRFVNRSKAVPVPGDGFVPEVVYAHEYTWIIGTYNDGYRGASTMNEAFRNRFRHLPWDYDPKVEKKLIVSDIIREIGERLRNAREMGDIQTPVGTRALQNLEEDCDSDGVKFAIWAFVGMFPSRERVAVRSILEDSSLLVKLTAEWRAKERERKIAAGEEVEAEAEPEPEDDLSQFPQHKYPWARPTAAKW
jgi:MoxR-like ATPase